MRIAELGRRSGIPVPTIKYYLREGLLPPGELSSPNQADYGEAHLNRLQLVRTLLETGHLAIATIREILTEIGRPQPDVHLALGRVLKAIGPDCIGSDAPEVDQLMTRQGWDRVGRGATARQGVADVLLALRRLGADEMLARLDDYAAVARRLAELDLEAVTAYAFPEAKVYQTVIGTILGDALIAGLRRLAQEDLSARAHGHTIHKLP
jgi:DNA-binding transcriptional MerR regulator